jgi:hypothetical protein
MSNHENKKAFWEHQWLWRAYGLFFLIVALLLTGCTTNSPISSNKPLRPTPTTLADAWKLLEQRPLRIPTLSGSEPCPITNKEILPYFGFASGKGPVSIRGTDDQFESGDPTPGDILQKDGWKVQKELWFIQPPYQGPILVRGHQLDGPHTLLFTGGYAQMNYTGVLGLAPTSPGLLLLGSTQYDYPSAWPSYGIARVPGCYIYQVDGLDFSGYFITQVVFGPY